MQSSSKAPEFQQLNAEFFAEKARDAKGAGKLLVALEMSNYISKAVQHGLSLEELEKAGFKFAKLPDIQN